MRLIRGINSQGGAAGNGLLTDLISYWSLDEASGNRADSHADGKFGLAP